MDEVWQPAERWSDAERHTWQHRRLREVLSAAVPHAFALAERLRSADVEPAQVSLDDLPRLPVLRKDTLPDIQRQAPPFGGWLGVPASRLRRVHRSPGPIYDPEGEAGDYWRFAPALFAAGIRPGDMVLNTFAYHLTPAGHMLDSGLRTLGCAVVASGPGNTDTQLSLLRDLPVNGFVGTPSFLATILEAAADGQVTHRLRTAFVIAEMLAESLRRRLQERFGVRVSQGYGTADLGSLAYECTMAQGMHVSHEVVLEVADPHTGAPVAPGTAGEVVVTALNPVYPLVRFGTGDLAVEAAGPCPCGRTGPRLARILGRVGDAVKVRGMFVHPAEVDRAMSRHGEVARYQIVVTRTGHADDMVLRAEVQPGAAVPADLRDRIRQTLQETVRLRGTVELVPAGTLPADAKRIVDQRSWE
jgi:phenylacetate-CoA ligase